MGEKVLVVIDHNKLRMPDELWKEMNKPRKISILPDKGGCFFLYKVLFIRNFDMIITDILKKFFNFLSFWKRFPFVGGTKAPEINQRIDRSVPGALS